VTGDGGVPYADERVDAVPAAAWPCCGEDIVEFEAVQRSRGACDGYTPGTAGALAGDVGDGLSDGV
jgi:hypothetical protein